MSPWSSRSGGPVVSVVSVVSLSPCPPGLPGSCLPTPSTAVYPTLLYPSGHAEPGPGSRILACGGRLWSRCGGPCLTGTGSNGGLSVTASLPVKLAPVREAPETSPRNGGAPKPRRPRQAPAPGRDTLSVPLPRGAVGERNAARFFAASVAPQSGRVGNEMLPFFFAAFRPHIPRSGFRLCYNNSDSTHSFIKNGPVSQLAKSG